MKKNSSFGFSNFTMISLLNRKPDPLNIQVVLAQLALITPLTEDFKKDLALNCFEVTVSKGDFLLRKGDFSYYIYFIVKGLITSHFIDKKQDITSFIAVDHEFVSSIEGLYGTVPCTENIMAQEESLLIGFSVIDVQRFIDLYPELNTILRKTLEVNYKMAHHRSVFFRIGTAADKYAYFIENYPLHASRLSIEVMASFLNIKLNTLQKIVKQADHHKPEGPVALSLTDIINYMNTEQPFRRKKITLLQLSGELGVSPHKLSHLLNLYFNKNFNHFINSYRINYVLSQLSEKINLEQYSLDGLGRESGFSSRSSFFSEFKKHTGLTPFTYLNLKVDDTLSNVIPEP